MLRNTFRMTSFLALLASILVCSCNPAPARPPATGALTPEGGNLRVALDTEILTVDPALTSDLATTMVIGQVVESLLRIDENGRLLPNLAEGWEARDPRTYQFTLRQDVLFHNGKMMTAEDVVYSLEHTRSTYVRMLKNGGMENVQKVEKLDERTIQVTLDQADVLFPYRMATPDGYVYSKAYMQMHAEDLNKAMVDMVGSGPYQFASWLSSSNVILQKNREYWNKSAGGPYIDSINFLTVPIVTTRIAYLRSGNVDLAVANIPADQIPILQRSNALRISFSPGLGGNAIVFNTRRPPFDNRTLRQALNLAVDKTAAMQALWGEAATPGRASAVTPAMWTVEGQQWQTAWEGLPSYACDLEKARRLLNESGVSPAEIAGRTILVDDDPIRFAEALVLQAAAGELGIQLKIDKTTPLALQETLSSGTGDFDLLVFDWNAAFPDPAAALVPFFHSKNIAAGGKNVAGYANPAVDRLLDEQNQTLDAGERARLLIQAQALIAEDAPWIVFGYPKVVTALNRRFTGLQITPTWRWGTFSRGIHLSAP